MKKIILIGGGTISHVRNHLALCAPAYGSTAVTLSRLFMKGLLKDKLTMDYSIVTHLTRMAGGSRLLETNEHMERLIEEIIADPLAKVVIFNPALVDFDGRVGIVESGKNSLRLETKDGSQVMHLTPSEKLIGKLRKERKDLFVVGFKTTTGATTDEQYVKGLELLKKNSLNLVLANDMISGHNIIIAPEETRYIDTTDRGKALATLTNMVLWRMNNTFTRSTVIEGQPVEWNSPEIPDNLRTVVDHCIAKGAYKPFLGKTAGHFAVKVNDHEILTSIRKTNFNELDKHGLVRVEYEGKDSVVAHGAKPSVGGMSQRIIFTEHPDVDCIVHFHCPRITNLHDVIDVIGSAKVRPPFKTAAQMPYECGSHQCGQNTSDNLMEVKLGDGDKLKVVYLDNHGPNIVFSKNTPAKKIIDFIENNFTLSDKTGGLV